MGRTFVSRDGPSYEELMAENDRMCDDLADIIENRVNAVQALYLLQDTIRRADSLNFAINQDAIGNAVGDIAAYLQRV